MQEEIKTETAADVRDNQDTLSETDLDNVSGGLNPQPLPPIVRDRV